MSVINRVKIKRYSSVSVAVLVCLSLCACAPKMVSKGDTFPLMYEEAPVSILVLPPINESTAADAKDYYATTIQEPLSFWGYYVFPYEVTTEILKMEGIYDSELLKNLPLQKFREYFGADAVLFTTIKKWDLTYAVLAANLIISIDCKLKSTKSNAILWKYNGTVVVDLSGQSSSSGGIAGLIAKAIVAAVNSAVVDYVPHARRANYMALRSFPYGKYHTLYGKDQDRKFREQIQKEE
jgi:hypothetical protein